MARYKQYKHLIRSNTFGKSSLDPTTHTPYFRPTLGNKKDFQHTQFLSLKCIKKQNLD